jgi:predicted  nucleic acid-binding Zn-ribbon protein
MPHQCLKCGKIFKEGSSQLLKGCPDCGGNRFFFTKKPLDQKERDEITREVGRDINTRLVDLLGGENSDIIDKSGKWITMKPKDIRKAFEKHLPDDVKTQKKVTDNKEDIKILPDEKHRELALARIKSEMKKVKTPETIDIEQSGKYSIDLKGLLEEEPIIIQKDGSYTIHLPSLFKMIDKEK